MNKRTFSAAQKSAIVLSVLTNKKTPSEVCAEHHIVPSLIHKWREQLLKEAHTIFEKSVDTATDRKVTRYEYIIAKLTTQNYFLERVLLVTK